MGKERSPGGRCRVCARMAFRSAVSFAHNLEPDTRCYGKARASRSHIFRHLSSSLIVRSKAPQRFQEPCTLPFQLRIRAKSKLPKWEDSFGVCPPARTGCPTAGGHPPVERSRRYPPSPASQNQVVRYSAWQRLEAGTGAGVGAFHQAQTHRRSCGAPVSVADTHRRAERLEGAGP